MAKSYASELEMLPATYAWAMSTDISTLVKIVETINTRSLLAVGSGGSLTTAQYAGELHQIYTHRLAKAATPLEAVSLTPQLKDVALLLASASGRNADVLASFKEAVNSEMRTVSILCMTLGSPLSALAAGVDCAHVSEFDLPAGRDGFLSTNSLLASCVVLSRAYEMVSPKHWPLPSTLSALIHPGRSEHEFLQTLEQECSALWDKDTVIVLHGSATRAAAMDIESKFTEAALGAVQLSDYRNFGHGRHHWLVKRGSTTGIIALSTDEDRELASVTLSALPPSIPVTRIEIDRQGPAASVAAVAIGLYIAGFAGVARGIDPGHPGVPQFGRRLYSLKTLEEAATIRGSMKDMSIVAVERKAGRSSDELISSGELAFWLQAFKRFVSLLKRTAFAGIVLDYDGTLCDDVHRLTHVSTDVADELIRMMESGLSIGIATGRGQSVKHALREVIPRDLWARILVGYYNGGDMGLLDDDVHPDRREKVCTELEPIAAALTSMHHLASMFEFTFRTRQITVDVRNPAWADEGWETVNRLIAAIAPGAVAVFQAPRSIDIVARGVSKALVADALARRVGVATTANMLCIGDSGRWPGNDSALLMHPYSLSVDEVSSDPDSCWNLAPLAHRGVKAILTYLRALHLEDGLAHLSPEQIWRHRQ